MAAFLPVVAPACLNQTCNDNRRFEDQRTMIARVCRWAAPAVVVLAALFGPPGVGAQPLSPPWMFTGSGSDRVFTVAGNGRAGQFPPAVGAVASRVGIGYPRRVLALADGGLVVLASEWSQVSWGGGSPPWPALDEPGDLALVWIGPNGRIVHVTPGRELGGWLEVASGAIGGLLVATAGGIELLDAHGGHVPLAGDGSPGFAGDGGQARAARIAPGGYRGSLAALRDGGFLIAEPANHRIRRVWPDGIITTAAGTGEPGQTGDGGPATAARIDQPRSLTPLADGRVVFDDVPSGEGRQQTRVLGVDGSIRAATATEAKATRASVPAGDGGVVLSDDTQTIRQVDAEGRERILMSRPREAFAGNGDQLVRFPGQGVYDTAVISSLAATRDGGLLFAIDSETAPDDFPAPASRVNPRVVLAVRPASKRLAVALTRGALRAGRRVRVGWRTTRPARLRFELHAGVEQRRLAGRTIHAHGRVGHAAIRWRLRPGRLYQVTVDASVAGRAAHDELWVVPGGRIEVAAARAFAATETFHWDEIDERVGRCRVVGARRVDCVIDDLVGPDPRGDPDRRCARVLAVTLRRNGQVWLADRHCPLRAHTRLSTPWPVRHPIAHATR